MKNRPFVAKMKMADVVSANHTLILAMPRFGISLGFGDRSVQEICAQYGLSVDFVSNTADATKQRLLQMQQKQQEKTE